MGKLMQVAAPPKPPARSQFGDFGELVDEILAAPLEGDAMVKVWDDLTPSASQTLADGLRGRVKWETTADDEHGTEGAPKRIMWARPYREGEKAEEDRKAEERRQRNAEKLAADEAKADA